MSHTDERFTGLETLMADVTHEVGRKLDEHASLIRKLDQKASKQGQVIEKQGLDISEVKLRLGTMDTRFA